MVQLNDTVRVLTLGILNIAFCLRPFLQLRHFATGALLSLVACCILVDPSDRALPPALAAGIDAVQVRLVTFRITRIASIGE